MFRLKGHVLEDGFTIIEMISVIAIISILVAISAPFGFKILERHRLSTARDEVYTAIRRTQDKAQQQKTPWRFAIRERDDYIEWTSYPDSGSSTSAYWQRLGLKSLQIDAETTLELSNGTHYVRFDERGTLQLWLLGRITLTSQHFPSIKRCVIVSTILGAVRKAEEQSSPDPEYSSGDRFCY